MGDALMMRMAAQRYFADGNESSRKALGYAIEDTQDALGLIDSSDVPGFVRDYFDTAVAELRNYQASVEKLLVQQARVVQVKTQTLDTLGPEIAAMARDLEHSVFGSLEAVADDADAETDKALQFTVTAFAISVVLG